MGMAAFKENTGNLHPLADGIKTSRRRDIGNISLINESSYMWYGNIKIGSPPVKFSGMTLSSGWRFLSDPVSYTVMFDTGSSDLFVPSKKCRASCEGHKRYNPASSTTSQDLGKDFTLSYLSNASVSGEQYSDVVTIAGLAVRDVLFFFSFPTEHSVPLTRLTVG